MANTITLDTTTSGNNTQGTNAIAILSLTTNGANRLAVLAIDNGAGPAVTSVTCSGGITFTKLGGSSNSGIDGEVWTANLPSAVSALTVTITGTSSSSTLLAVLDTYYLSAGTGGGVPIITTSGFNSTAPGSTESVGPVTTVSANDHIAAYLMAGGGGAVSSPSGYTTTTSKTGSGANMVGALANANTPSAGTATTVAFIASGTGGGVGVILALNNPSAAPAPTATAAPTCTVVSSTQVNVTIPALTANATSFNLERALAPGGIPGSYSVVSTGVTPSSTYNDTGLAPATQYAYRINAIGAGGNTESSASTPTTFTAPGAPNVPAVGNTTTGGTTLPVNTQALTSNATSEVIQVSTNIGFTTPITGSPFAVPTPGTAVNVTGLTSGTTYYIRIGMVGSGGTTYGPVLTVVFDTTAPILVSSTINTNGTTMVLSFSGLGAPVQLASGTATLAMTGGAVTLSGISISGLTVTANLSRPVASNETGTISIPAGMFTDSAVPTVNPMSAVVAAAVTNNSVVVASIASPTAVTATYQAGVGINIGWVNITGSYNGVNIYKVRSDSYNGIPKRINEAPLPIGTTSYVDREVGLALNGQTGSNVFTYYVTAVNTPAQGTAGLTSESPLSTASSSVTWLG